MTNTSDRDLEAVARLKSEGVRESTARRLVAEHGPERCVSNVEALETVGPRNRAAWVVTAIRRGWAAGEPA